MEKISSQKRYYQLIDSAVAKNNDLQITRLKTSKLRNLDFHNLNGTCSASQFICNCKYKQSLQIIVLQEKNLSQSLGQNILKIILPEFHFH